MFQRLAAPARLADRPALELPGQQLEPSAPHRAGIEAQQLCHAAVPTASAPQRLQAGVQPPQSLVEQADEQCPRRVGWSGRSRRQRAILLGCTRKSMALLGQPRAQPIRSLYYFQALLQEVLAETYPRSYWQHLRDHLERCEQRWAQAERSAAPQPACPNLTPAEPQPTLLAEATTHTGAKRMMMMNFHPSQGVSIDGGAALMAC